MTLADAAARRRAETETGSSFLVEASAGTGKTTTLVKRIVHLVLRRGESLGRIAAMTFTEKASGEMKTRLRRELDDVLVAEKDPTVLARGRQAYRELESAEISTIHAFCRRLLKERPVEADVDPDFVAADELTASDLVDEVFAEWFDAEARLDAGPVAAALRAGASPVSLQGLAVELYGKRPLLDEAFLPSDPLAEIRERAAEAAPEVDEILQLLPGTEKHKEQRETVEEWRSALARLQRASEGTAPELLRLPGKIALTTAWPADARARIKAWRPRLETLEDLLAALPLVPLLSALVGRIRSGLFASIDRRKSERAVLDFDDLLLRARDLLRRSRAARDHFRERFATLVVDEFQDTDPVQAEIVLRLSAAEPQDARDWSSLSPEPGRLFLVGDAKQSIYRFRRADVETYGATRTRIGEGNVLTLSTNFRSSRAILRYVNAVGPALLTEVAGEPWHVGYAPLTANAETPAGRAPAVFYLSPPAPGVEPGPEDGEEPNLRQLEARAVANFLLKKLSSGPNPWQRIAILVPRNDTIELYQQAFHDAGIPFALEGGRSFYRREEVAAVVAALQAVDDPGDAISVVAAFKSFLFGASDLDLLAAAERGARFDDPRTIPEGTPLFPAAQLLLNLHRDRHARPLAATLAELFAARSAFAAVENGAVVNPVQGVANLERFLVFARALDGEGLSFREAVERLGRRLEEEGPEPSAFEEKADAVRLMTLYKAKGLEFDTVVLADFGLKEAGRSASPDRIVCDRAGGRFGVSLPFGPREVGTARLEAITDADEKRAVAETRRLLYVGLTRARSTLVLSWFRHLGETKDGPTDNLGKSLLAPLAPFEVPAGEWADLVEVVPPDLSKPTAAPRMQEPAAVVDLPAALRQAEERLARVRETASRPLRRAGEKDAPFLSSTPEDTEPADRDDAPDRARRIGVAVHEAMEQLLGTPAPPGCTSKNSALDAAFFELTDDERAEARPLVETLLAHDVTRRALSSKRRFVEMPLLYFDEALPGRPLVEGKVDLLFEEADGWQIVDWKTDRLAGAAARAEREALYEPQLRAYEEGVRKVLGPGARVKPGLLVFAREARRGTGPS